MKNKKSYLQKVKNIKQNHARNLNWLSKHKFGTRRHLLWVVRQAYRNVLDNVSTAQSQNQRLNKKEQFELGQNLAKYWYIKK